MRPRSRSRKAEKTDVPPGSDEIAARRPTATTTPRATATTCSAPTVSRSARTSSRCARATTTRRAPARTCSPTTTRRTVPPNKYAKDTECKAQLEALGPAGPPAGSRVIKVPQGIVVVEAEPAPNQPARDARASSSSRTTPSCPARTSRTPSSTSTRTRNEPLVTMEFTDKGREAFAARHEAHRRARLRDDRRRRPDCPTRRTQTSSSTSRSRSTTRSSRCATIDFQRQPGGHRRPHRRPDRGIGTIQQAQDLAESLRIGALPIELKLISQTQVSATLGQQALDQGLIAGGGGPRAHVAVPARLLPRARPGGHGRRC